MRYILTGKYYNGDEYGDATRDINELAYMLSDIYRWYDNETISPDQRIDITTLIIETEEKVGV